MFDERQLRATIADDVLPLLEGINAVLPGKIDEDLFAWLRSITDGKPESTITLNLLANVMPKVKPQAMAEAVKRPA